MTRLDVIEESGHGDDPYICASCGNCTMVCPTFRLGKWESFGPRGRLQVTKNILEGKAKFDEEYVRKLFMCSLCENCASVCTTSLKLDEFWREARAQAWEMGMAPKPAKYASSSIMRYGDPLAMGSSSRLRWAQDFEIDITDRIEANAKVGYILGCDVALKPQLNDIARSMVKILEHAGVEYTLLGEKETCCGAPMLWAGNKSEVHLIAEKNYLLLEELGVEKVIFSCPSCIYIWHIVGSTTPHKRGNSPLKLYTSSQFISILDKNGLLAYREQPMITVTYHDPCISARRLGIYHQPRDLIEHIPGVYKVEMAYSGTETRCCGWHGLLNLTNPLVSLEIAEMRMRDVSVTPASRVISECPRCIQALDTAGQTMQYELKVQDITQLVAECLVEPEKDGGS